jgi:hypothetical protein
MDLKLALAEIGVCAYPALKSLEQNDCCCGSDPPRPLCYNKTWYYMSDAVS